MSFTLGKEGGWNSTLFTSHGKYKGTFISPHQQAASPRIQRLAGWVQSAHKPPTFTCAGSGNQSTRLTFGALRHSCSPHLGKTAFSVPRTMRVKSARLKGLSARSSASLLRQSSVWIPLPGLRQLKDGKGSSNRAVQGRRGGATLRILQRWRA